MLKNRKRQMSEALAGFPATMYARSNDGILLLGTDEHTLAFLLQMVAMRNLGVKSTAEADELSRSIAKEHEASLKNARKGRGWTDGMMALVSSSTSVASNAYAYLNSKKAIEAYKLANFKQAFEMIAFAAICLVNAGKEYEDERAQKAASSGADMRHSAPGGSRAKQNAIRIAWASGRYTSRDICAEQECGALDMSFSAARKALRNTPDPTQPMRGTGQHLPRIGRSAKRTRPAI